MVTTYKDATVPEVHTALQHSWQAFQQYRQKNLKQRAQFLRAIAAELQTASAELIATAQRETHLEEARLKVEWERTLFQLTSYAAACEEGSWLDVRIDVDTQGLEPQRNPPKPDLRKMLVPLGPVVVFGASNFPFAYSTAGGDTACALAAGCTVINKAHPAHANTSELTAAAIQKAARQCGLPEGVFIHLHGANFQVGKALVQHPLTKAVGFTGSYQGGKALFDTANARKVPIPVFAEMSSVNPVFLLQQKLQEEAEQMAAMYATSITQSAGQFCTNPGILVAIESEDLYRFINILGKKIRQVAPQKMLHAGIADSFYANRTEALTHDGVEMVAQSTVAPKKQESIPTLAVTDAQTFLNNRVLREEVFGPYSLMVICEGKEELMRVAQSLEGQLTITLMATGEELREQEQLVAVLQDKCGRFILNGVPTGVEPVLAMHHGGPFPATTDSRFTAVGADGIKRFARPLCYQNWTNDLLPDELKNENPLGLWRTVNNQFTKESV